MAKTLEPEVSCPQCGADTPSHGRIATSCKHCETLLVLVDGGPKRAQAFDGHLPRDGATVALICRFCAGALPDKILTAPSGTRCDYCGQRPELSPTLLALLKVMVTHPRALPPAAKQLLRYWLGLATVFFLVVGLYALLPPTDIHGSEYISLSSAKLTRTEGAKQFYDVQARSSTFEVRPRGTTYPNLMLQAWEFQDSKLKLLIPNQRMDLLVTLVREETGERRSKWLNLYDGAKWRPSDSYPESHPYSNLYLYDTGGTVHMPPGKYHVEIAAARTEGGPLPAKVEAEWNTSYSNMNMWFILGLNLGMWLFIFEVRAIAKDATKPARLVTVRSVIAGVVLLVTLVEVIHPFDPFGAKTTFVPREETK